MRFAVSAAAILAFVSSALAQAPTGDFNSVSKPEKDENVPAGSTYVVTWTAAAKYSGKVSISLLGGNDPTTLQVVETVATGVDNAAGKYSWAVGKTLGSAKTYGLKFVYESDQSIFQFSQPFHITGGVASSSGSSSATGSSSSVSATSSSASTTMSITSSASSSSSSSAAPSTTVVKTTSFSNSTMTTGAKTTLATQTSATTSASGTSKPSTIPSNNAGRVAAGSLALFAGVAAAVFAL